MLSALLEIDHQGDVVAQEFTRGVIRSVERMTYTNVHLLLEGDAGAARALRAAGGALRADAGTGADAEPQARAPRLHRFRPARAAHRVRRVGRDDRRDARAAQHRAPHHRGVHAGGQRSRGGAPGDTPASASIYRIHEKPDPKRVMEFEEVAAHFGYSLGVGAIPVKKFGITDRHRDGTKRRREIVLAGPEIEHLVAPLPEAGGEDRGQARGAHPELPDAALAQAGALQRRRTRATSRWRRTPTRTSRRPSAAIRTWWCTACCAAR